MDLKMEHASLQRGCHQRLERSEGFIRGESNCFKDFDEARKVAFYIKDKMAKRATMNFIRVGNDSIYSMNPEQTYSDYPIVLRITAGETNVNNRSERANIRRENRTLETFASQFSSRRVQKKALGQRAVRKHHVS